jgi:hypothetical protein
VPTTSYRSRHRIQDCPALEAAKRMHYSTAAPLHITDQGRKTL